MTTRSITGTPSPVTAPTESQPRSVSKPTPPVSEPVKSTVLLPGNMDGLDLVKKNSTPPPHVSTLPVLPAMVGAEPHHALEKKQVHALWMEEMGKRSDNHAWHLMAGFKEVGVSQWTGTVPALDLPADELTGQEVGNDRLIRSLQQGSSWQEHTDFANGVTTSTTQQTEHLGRGYTESLFHRFATGADGQMLDHSTWTDHEDGTPPQGGFVFPVDDAVRTEANAVVLGVQKTATLGVIKAERPLPEKGSGLGSEVHLLTATGVAQMGAGLDLTDGTLNAGGNVSGRVDLLGASSHLLVRNTRRPMRQLYLHGEGHVGARTAVGGTVMLNPRRCILELEMGVEGFAGAEAKGEIGWHNRYVGLGLEAATQTGMALMARGDVGVDQGMFMIGVNLGACAGVGGRVKVNVSVNVGAMAHDVKGTMKQGTARAVYLASRVEAGAEHVAKEVAKQVEVLVHQVQETVQRQVDRLSQRTQELVRDAKDTAVEAGRQVDMLSQQTQGMVRDTAVEAGRQVDQLVDPRKADPGLADQLSRDLLRCGWVGANGFY